MTSKSRTLHCANVLDSDWVEAQAKIISLHIAVSFAVAIKYMEDRKKPP